MKKTTFIIIMLFSLSAKAEPIHYAFSYIKEGPFSAGGLILQEGSSLKHNRIDIETIGDNTHHCVLKGTIDSGIIKAEEEECRLRITNISNDMLEIQTLDEGDSCHRIYCGMRADLIGYYRRLPSECSYENINAQLNEVRLALQTDRLSEATDKLEEHWEACSDFIGEFLEGDIRLLLAQAYRQQKNHEKCQNILQVLYRDFNAQNEEDKETASDPTAMEHNRALLQQAKRLYESCENSK